MRMETNTERYEGFEQIFDGVQECPVDTEYTLPDYCADIQKILKCIVTPEVTSVSAAGDSLTIDGCASMHVLYLDAKGGCVRGFDTKKEFTCSVRLRAQAENVTAEAEPFVQHMTCRAMNARRVDLHITLGLSVRAYAVRQLEIADCISDDRVETKCEEYDVTRAVGCVMHAFILEQNAELPNGKSPIETVLRCSVRYQIDRCSHRRAARSSRERRVWKSYTARFPIPPCRSAFRAYCRLRRQWSAPARGRTVPYKSPCLAANAPCSRVRTAWANIPC